MVYKCSQQAEAHCRQQGLGLMTRPMQAACVAFKKGGSDQARQQVTGHTTLTNNAVSQCPISCMCPSTQG